MTAQARCGLSDATVQYRNQLSGNAGIQGLAQNFRVLSITCFACIGGMLYGYNQGVFSGVLTMPSFGAHMDDYITNSTKKG